MVDSTCFTTSLPDSDGLTFLNGIPSPNLQPVSSNCNCLLVTYSTSSFVTVAFPSTFHADLPLGTACFPEPMCGNAKAWIGPESLDQPWDLVHDLFQFIEGP